LLKGKTVNLLAIEKEDLTILKHWVNDLDFVGSYEPIIQETCGELEIQYNRTLNNGGKWFFIVKNDGAKIGYVAHYLAQKRHEIGYGIIPNERNKGYCTEAANLLVDYLFLSKDIVRIQALTDSQNRASQKVLKKLGFTEEGIIRKANFEQGKWRDSKLFSVLREEWKTPKLLKERL
jgi:RimJ/RimL family protein N-acetyltransferase